jgi:putative FmdB family regulatory protein
VKRLKIAIIALISFIIFLRVFMPIYEYQCQSCGHQHEALQKMNAAPLIDCPVCAKPKLTKQISAAGFRLKGDGWYETDFKQGSKKNVAGETKTKADANSVAKASKKENNKPKS